MDLTSFSADLRRRLPPGTVLPNPGRGTTTIIWSDDDRLCYQRGSARFYVALSDLFDALRAFRGRDVTTTDLKRQSPGVFDSARGGHNCHATVLFLIAQSLKLAGEVWGRGHRGSPFGITLSSYPLDSVDERVSDNA